ncbi:MAG: MraY family glycosyltransferase, partial [Planctomycetota bacterium]
GANLGFLLYNFPPARIFMGDSGSLFMGYMLATSAVQCSVYPEKYSLYPIIIPLLILSIPIYDTLSVILIRIRQGYSIFRADNNHFSHRLVALGFSRPHAVLLIYLVTFTTGITATLLDQLDLRGGILVALQIFCTLIIIALLEITGKKTLEKTKEI